jgi:hypothetical protein
MPQQKIITIPKPCFENWDNMSPTNQGKHCFSCEKEVVDFTRFSDEELLQYFSKPKNNDQKVCGRFKQSQVHQNTPETATTLRTNVPWQQFLYLLITIIYPAFVSCQNQPKVKGQIAIITTTDTQKIVPKDTQIIPEILGEVVEIHPKQTEIKPTSKKLDNNPNYPMPEPEIMGKIAMPQPKPNPPNQKPKIPVPIKRDEDGRIRDRRPRPIKPMPSNEPRICIPEEPVIMGDTIIQDSK